MVWLPHLIGMFFIHSTCHTGSIIPDQSATRLINLLGALLASPVLIFFEIINVLVGYLFSGFAWLPLPLRARHAM